MLVISGNDVNQIFHEAMWKIPVYGNEEGSRNGRVMAVPTPVATMYLQPTNRMLFHPKRDANPFFHIMEAMWMLIGRNEVDLVARYAANLRTFSDDGVTLNGAYGHRWSYHFGHDQLRWVVQHLINDPTSRRCVLTMWDPTNDPLSVETGSKDVPCNTHIYFRVTGGKLDMTVCCRSNDAIWGAYGSNVVHMSYLHEYVSQATGIPMGVYYQMSNNLHVYERHWDLFKPSEEPGPYPTDGHMDLLDGCSPYTFLSNLERFFADFDTTTIMRSNYVSHVIQPMEIAWQLHKHGDTRSAISVTEGLIQDRAVSIACSQWLRRRIK